MQADLKILAVIPARTGSKRLAAKNTMPLGGRPLIEWTINAAIEAECFDEIVVSSDGDEILALASGLGVHAQKRPAVLASDTARSVDVVSHVIDVYAATGRLFDAVMLLQPTSPLRTANDIITAVELFVSRAASSVISMSPVDHSPLWSCQLPDDQSLELFYSSLRMLPDRSQDLPGFYRLNGAIYLVRTIDFLRDQTFFCDPGIAYIMPSARSVDIDDRVGFLLCQSLLDAAK